MKISKLFHWLYALVMLLPIFALGTTCLISTFNMSSKQESEINYKFDTNDIVYNSDLIIGNYYAFDFDLFYKDGILDGNVLQDNDTYIRFDNCYLPVDYELDYPYVFENYVSDIASPLYNGLTIECGILDGDDYLHFGLYDNYIGGYNYLSDLNLQFYRRIYGRLNYFSFENYNYLTNLGDYIHVCPIDVLPIESVETHNLDTQEVFYRSVNKVVESPLFNWAYDSFLVTPFAYIVNLFSMPINSVIVMLLSYWLAISIIWLVFDLIMYVPLLVHRWLDKGVLE